MARETLDLFIKVTDSNGAATFQRLGAAGKKATDEITKGSKSGTTALKDMGREADRAAQAAQKLESGFTKAGAAIGTGIGVLSKLGQASTEERRQIDGITRAYGEASAQVLAFAEQVQDSTVFSNDAAREAALAASSLASNYGLTADQIGDLVARSADLASVFGIDLVDATTRVAGAIRGEGEAAELLALNLSDSAVAAAAAAAGLTGWNTTMTEGEKAAFRYSLLMEQSAYATGAAGDAADTTRGQVQQFRNEIQDAAADLGELAGPAAEAASVLGDLALIAPAAGAGIGKLAGMAVTAAGASGLGGLAAGIAGVGLAAGVAIVPLAAFTAVMIQGAEERSDDFTADFEEQTARLNALGLAADENAKKVFDWVRTSNQTGGALNGQVVALNDSFDELLQLRGPYLETILFMAQGMDQETESAATLGQAIIDLYQTQREGDAVAYAYAQQELYLGTQTEAYADAVERTVAIEERLLSVRQRQAAQRNAEINRTAGPRRAGVVDPNADDMGLPDADAEAARVEARILGIQTAADGMGNALRENFLEAAAAQEALAEELSAVNQEMIGFVASGENIIDVLIRAGGALTGNQGFLRGVRDLIDAQGALDSTFATIIGGTEALGQSGQQVADWASELTGVSFDGSTFAYEISAIDTALQNGKISQEEYNAAVTAGEDILYNNALIQADIAAMQAQQAPLIADRTNAYQDQIDALAKLSPAEQRHALLMMDSGIQAQVATAYSTAYAASLGEIPEDVASELILAEAASNPDLAALLEELGLIEKGADGTVRVNFPDGDSMTETLGTLNETLEDLIEIIAEVNGLTISPKVDPAASAAIAAFSKPRAGAGPGDGTGGSGPAASQPIYTGSTGEAGQGYGAPKPIVITVDTSQALPAIEALQAEVLGLTTDEYVASVVADAAGAIALTTSYQDQLVTVDETEVVAGVGVDTTQAVNDTADVQAQLVVVDNTAVEATATADTAGAVNPLDALMNQLLGQVDGASATVSAYADTSSARASLDGLTGFQGSAYIHVYATPIGSFGPQSLGLATGGTMYPGMGEYAPMIPSYANGGTHAMVGELGPEMVWLPNGAQVTNAVATESRLRGGRDRGGTIANYGTIVIQAPNADVYGAIRSSMLAGGG